MNQSEKNNFSAGERAEIISQAVAAMGRVRDRDQLWPELGQLLAPRMSDQGLMVHLWLADTGQYATFGIVEPSWDREPPPSHWLEKIMRGGPDSQEYEIPGQGAVLRAGWPLIVDDQYFGVLELRARGAGLREAGVWDLMSLLAAGITLFLQSLMSKPRDSSSILEKLLDSLPEGLALFDGQGRMIYNNPAARALFEAGADSAQGLRTDGESIRWLSTAVRNSLKGSGAESQASLLLASGYYQVQVHPLALRSPEDGAIVLFRDLGKENIAKFRELTTAINNLSDIELFVQSLLKEIQVIVNFHGAMLLTREKGEHFRLLATLGLPRSEQISDQELMISSGIIQTAVAESRAMVLSGQAGQLAADLGSPQLASLVTEAVSLVVSPLSGQGEVSGLVVLTRHSGAEFRPQEVSVIEELSAMLVRTVEHIRSLVSISHRTQLRDKLYEIGFAAGSVLQVGSLLSLMIRTIAKEMRADEMGIYFYDEVAGAWSGKSILAKDAGSGFLSMIRNTGIGLEPERLAEIREITAEVIARGLPEIVPDLASDPRYVPPSPQSKLRSGIWLPLKVKDRAIGALSALSMKPAFFTQEDMTVLTEVAPLVTFALRSAMLYEEIRREGSRVGAIINSMPEGLLMVDLDLKVIMSNQSLERQWKLDSPVKPGADLVREVVPKFVEKLVHPKALLDFYQNCATARTEMVGPVEVELKGRRFLKIISFPVEQPERAHGGLVILHQDITEQRNLEELRQEFVGMLSHDLRNPLSAVIATLDLALDGSLGPLNNDQRQFLNNAMNDSRRMLEMLNDFLDGYKYEAVELKLDRAEFDLGQMLQRAMEDFSPLASEKQITLTLEEPGIHMVVADEGKLNRVVSNLLSNAIKFTPRGGRVTLRLKEYPKYTEVSVTDTGEGIPEDERDRIFEKFYQVEKRRLGRKAGTGLGLPLCKKVVEAHGGSIWVESTLGQGSRFVFTIPK